MKAMKPEGYEAFVITTRSVRPESFTPDVLALNRPPSKNEPKAPVRLTSIPFVNEEMRQHINALGFVSLSSYELWCRRNGSSTSLIKSSDDLQAEIEYLVAELEAPREAENHKARRPEYIRRIASGEFDGQPLTSEMSCFRKLFQEVGDVDGGRGALLRLLLHVEKVADLLHTRTVFRNMGNGWRNQLIAGLSQLARHHPKWIRPVEEWFPSYQGRHRQRQFSELAEHLFIRYEMPCTLHSAWFELDDAERHIQQGWILHIAAGKNIRTAESLPFTLTKRAAHLFTNSGTRASPPIALRDAQIHAIGSIRQFNYYLSHNEHICGRENADFWTGIVQFFLNNPMLERGYIGPIVDYIHHQKFVPQGIPQPDGTLVERPPAHPNFNIKSRSITRLVREVDEWHETLTGEESDKVQQWEPISTGPFELEENNKELKTGVRWTVEELCTSSLLYLEGRRLHHCVGSYARECVVGEAAIFSIRAQPVPREPPADGEEPEKTHVLTVAVDPKKRKVTQARGKFNLQPEGRVSRAKAKRTNGPYQGLLREPGRILALWRAREGFGYGQN